MVARNFKTLLTFHFLPRLDRGLGECGVRISLGSAGYLKRTTRLKKRWCTLVKNAPWQTQVGWELAGIPLPIIRFVALRSKERQGVARDRYLARIARFSKYYFDHSDANRSELVSRAWAAVERSCASAGSLVNFFAAMPDQPTSMPFARTHGVRVLDWAEEQSRYRKLAGDVDRLLVFLEGSGQSPVRPNLIDLIHDIDASSAKVADPGRFSMYRNVQEALPMLQSGLVALAEILKGVDASAKYLTSQPLSPNSAQQTYVVMLVSLYRYLDLTNSVPHAAIATLANINCATATITPDQLRKAFKRHGIVQKI
jgi:hypothetical protein